LREPPRRLRTIHGTPDLTEMLLVGSGRRPYARDRMNDEVQKLRETLATLHAELGAVESGDPEVRRMLLSALQDINTKLEARSAATDASADPTLTAPMSEELAKAARLFEVEHPTLAATLRSVIEGLARAGI
jgi:transposase